MFKVGDLIIGLDEASMKYSITRKGCVMEVTTVYSPTYIEGKIIVSVVGGCVGERYDVGTECFGYFCINKGRK